VRSVSMQALGIVAHHCACVAPLTQAEYLLTASGSKFIACVLTYPHEVFHSIDWIGLDWIGLDWIGSVGD
jgi:hypothetical protein